jgi:hypothetical protein
MSPPPGDGPADHAFSVRRDAPWRRAAPWLLLGLAALTVPAAWQLGLYAEGGWTMLALLAQGALFNVSAFAGYLALRERWMRREDEATRMLRELRYLRAWAGEEGRLRKAGLIRDLNALGAVPAHLEQIVLAEADLGGADLRGCSLRESDLRGANLQGARLEGADLWGADLSGANLTLASLQGAVLRGCAMRDAQLPKANLEFANLHRADLVNANIEGARLEGANLERVRFAMTEARGGDFPEAIHPSVEDWIRAKLDERGCYVGGDAEREPPEAKPSKRARG